MLRDSEVSVPSVHRHFLSEGSRTPAEENHVQPRTALLPATAEIGDVVVLDKSAVATPTKAFMFSASSLFKHDKNS